MSASPRRPSKAQERSEKVLRDMGVTITFSPAAGVPHDHPEYVDGCFRCEMVESIARVNEEPR